jgi:GMP synthase PP-ATPase subunit|tara:strand:- start:143 stop:562 length:420 start_codon:yes stop_codon:yes gene_type:complete
MDDIFYNLGEDPFTKSLVKYMNKFAENDTKKLQNLAIKVDKILKDELLKKEIKYAQADARIYDKFTSGVQGDKGTRGHPAELELRGIKNKDGRDYTEKEMYEFLEKLSIRITNEVEGVNKVVWVTATEDNRSEIYDNPV